MIKKILRSSIIVTGQLFLLVILVLCISPLLFTKTHSLNQLHQWVHEFKWVLLMAHVIFYAALYFLWPVVIHYLIQKQSTQPSEPQVHAAMSARFYLIGMFLVFEFLNLLR